MSEFQGEIIGIGKENILSIFNVAILRLDLELYFFKVVLLWVRIFGVAVDLNLLKHNLF